MSGIKSGFSQPAIGDGPAPKRVGLLAARRFLEVRFAGTTAQGVMIMGLVLATAATRDHRYVAQTQTHGLEESGDANGQSDALGHSDVIISDDPVDYPELLGADLLVALCQGAVEAHLPMLRPQGVLLYDSQQVTSEPVFEGASYGVPLAQLTQEVAVEGESAPELLVLGLTATISGVVSAESLEKTLDDIALPGSLRAKKRAFAYGLAMDPAEWRRGS